MGLSCVEVLVKTQTAYIRAVVKLTRFLGRSPDTATAEDLRLLQLDMSETGVSSITMNATITGLRFLFEVTRLLDAAASPKYRAALALAYGAGLRASEVTHLTVNDIDSERMIIHVVQGKGDKDRNAMLSPELLKLLRQWWRTAHGEGKILADGWLFPGQNPANPMTTRQLNRACHIAIANSRLMRLDDTGVTFKYKDYRDKGRYRSKTMTLSTNEFIRRFLIHVLPSGFHRIRHYGLLAQSC